MKLKKIKKALISVSDKSNLSLVLPVLKKFNIEIISSGGSFKKIKSLKYDCTEITSYTGFPEILDGRVKTLHPKIHAGILNRRKNKNHKKTLKKHKINNIDLVIVDLYPFESEIKKKRKVKELIEYIDVGGTTLIRAAAKNFEDVVVISNTNDYRTFVKQLETYNGSTSLSFRKLMATKAFNTTAYYDSVISNWFNEYGKINFPEKKTIHGKLIGHLRYGENPHQKAGLYSKHNYLNLNKVHGKELSYNNYNDIYSALHILETLKKSFSTVIIKHSNPSGVSTEKKQLFSFKNALLCDPVSAFGGVVGINSVISKKLALELSKFFFEVIVSKGFNKDALKLLKKKKNIRLIEYKDFNLKESKHYLDLQNSFLLQDSNSILINKKLKVVTKKKPSINQINNLIFAFNVCKFVKSNAIVLSNNRSTIGIGSGQPSRLDSCKIASSKAQKFSPEKIVNCVAASDAFFPFVDGIEELIKIGVKAIIQPGGSINDREVINAANKAGIAMVFTGTRHFKH